MYWIIEPDQSWKTLFTCLLSSKRSNSQNDVDETRVYAMYHSASKYGYRENSFYLSKVQKFHTKSSTKVHFVKIRNQ